MWYNFFMKRLNSKAGFTLLELLIVIGILAVLATVAVLVINPIEYVKNARIKGTQESINQLADAIIKVKGFSGKGLIQITGSVYSAGPCISGTSTVDTLPGCATSWSNALTKITAEGTSTAVTGDLRGFAKDSFGNPYLLDENEGEGGNCNRDVLRSAGPDRIGNTSDDIFPHGTSQYIINVTPACL